MLGSPAQPPAFSEALQSRLYLKDEETEAQTLAGSYRVTGRDEDPERADGTHALPMAPGGGCLWAGDRPSSSVHPQVTQIYSCRAHEAPREFKVTDAGLSGGAGSSLSTAILGPGRRK